MAIVVALQFKKAFEDARNNNADLAGSAAPAPHATGGEKLEETTDSEHEDEAEENEPEATETKPSAAGTGENSREG